MILFGDLGFGGRNLAVQEKNNVLNEISMNTLPVQALMIINEKPKSKMYQEP
jgi:hypothetical protein